MRILIVDDEPVSRLVLARKLQGWGHDVAEACDGAEAWELLQREPFRMVISDWKMPVMDGVELTRRIRAARTDGYVYVVLLTASVGVDALVEGMDAGADDYMVKPFQAEELRSRLRAGERVLQLESDLAERNRKLGDAYSSARRDLEAAAEMQKALLPQAGMMLPLVKPAWRFLPASFVAGDVFQLHTLDDHRACFYLLDVAGHGVPSAMLSFSLSKLLAPTLTPDGLLKRPTQNAPFFEIATPAEVLRELNDRYQDDSDALKYFTMVYGIIDGAKNELTLAQAGHPSPVLQRGDQITRLGESGYPVGMLPGLDYEDITVPFLPGDRLFLYSDGVTECANDAREPYRIERLEQAVAQGRDEELEHTIAGIEQELRQWHGDGEFADDVTLFALERRAA